MGQLVADTLSCAPHVPLRWRNWCTRRRAAIRSSPFSSFLRSPKRGLLRFDHDAARWRWELDRLHAKGYTENVVDLMVGKLTRLSAETQAALQQLACLGNVAEITMLSIVLGKSNEEVRSDLWDAVRLELVEQLEGSYRFTHDRVQEAAYSFIPERVRAEAHLLIGRLLVAHTPAEKREEAVFEIVNQLNRGAALITSRDEREQLAELNLIAGGRAKATTAYASALTYFTAGAALLIGGLLGAPARAQLWAGVAPGRMRVPDRCVAASGAAIEGAFDPRRKYGGSSHRRVPARGPVHGPRPEQSCHCRRSRLSPASGDRLVAASDERGGAARIRADLVTTREPHDRGSGRSAFDERPGIARDAGRSDQDRSTCSVYGCEPGRPGRLPSGQSQP